MKDLIQVGLLSFWLVFQVKWLLRRGAKITHDKYGKTPMNDAAENEQVFI